MFISSDVNKIIPLIAVIVIVDIIGLNIIIIPSTIVIIESNNSINQLLLSTFFKFKASWNFIILLKIIHTPIIIGNIVLIHCGKNKVNPPAIISTIPSKNSKLKILNSCGVLKYDTIWIIPSITIIPANNLTITFIDDNGFNIKNIDNISNSLTKFL